MYCTNRISTTHLRFGGEAYYLRAGRGLIPMKRRAPIGVLTGDINAVSNYKNSRDGRSMLHLNKNLIPQQPLLAGKYFFLLQGVRHSLL